MKKLLNPLALAAAFICLSHIVFAQPTRLNLKKKDQFQIETILENTIHQSSYDQLNFVYNLYDISVAKFDKKKGIYTLVFSIKETLHHTRNPWDSVCFDSRDINQPEVLQSYYLSLQSSLNEPLLMKINTLGEIIGFENLENYREKLVAKVKDCSYDVLVEQSISLLNNIYSEDILRDEFAKLFITWPQDERQNWSMENEDFSLESKQNGVILLVSEQEKQISGKDEPIFLSRKTSCDQNTGLILASSHSTTKENVSFSLKNYVGLTQGNIKGIGYQKPRIDEYYEKHRLQEYLEPRNKVVMDMRLLVSLFHQSGKSDEVKKQLISFWEEHDADNKENYDYQLTKAHAIWNVVDYEAYKKVFNAIPDEYMKGSSDIFNRLQERYDNDLDASLYLINKLYRANVASFDDWLDNTFSQSFKKRNEPRDISIQRELLKRLEEHEDQNIRESIQPMATWVKIQDNAGDKEVMKTMIEEVYNDSAVVNHRYHLMMYDLYNDHPEFQEFADTLLAKTIIDIKERLDTLKAKESNGRNITAKRAEMRYLLAHASFKRGETILERNEKINNSINVISEVKDLQNPNDLFADKNAFYWFQQAAKYSPDSRDITVKWAYHYHKYFVDGKEEYQSELTKRLDLVEDIDAFMLSLFDLTITEPSFFSDLKSIYAKMKPEGDFKQFFKESLSSKLPKVSGFSLSDLSGKQVEVDGAKQQWMLFDFWGTWCAPCVKGLPEIQRIYNEQKEVSEADKLNIYTIDCKDSESAVKRFVADKQYTFPVLISDKEIIKKYKIQGYPTKVLVFPTGEYIKVSFNDSLTKRLGEYMDFDVF